MKNTESFLIQLLKISDTISGRKKIQKVSYILQSLGAPIDEYFKYHLFGPYSFDLQLKIDEMVEQGYLTETAEKKTKNSGYIYNLNKSNKYVKTQELTLLDTYEKLILNLNAQSSVTLEIIATIFFLRRQGYKDEKLIKEKIQILKPSLENKIDEAYSIYNRLLPN